MFQDDFALSFCLLESTIQKKLLKMLDFDEKARILEAMSKFINMSDLYHRSLKDGGDIDNPILHISSSLFYELSSSKTQSNKCLAALFVNRLRYQQIDNAEAQNFNDKDNESLAIQSEPNLDRKNEVLQSCFEEEPQSKSFSESLMVSYKTTLIPSRSFRETQPTEEQNKAIELSSAGLIVNSFAGTGKTTLSGHIIDYLGQTSTLYSSFLRENSTEAKSKVTQHAFTQDALAMRYALAPSPFAQSFNAKIASRFTSTDSIKMVLGFPNKLDSGRRQLKSWTISRFIQQTLENYCQSNEPLITENHVPSIVEFDDTRIKLKGWATEYWDYLLSRHSHEDHIIKFSHIMKFWALSPNIQIEDKYKNVIIDEAQDINGAFFSVLVNHQDRNIVAIGDTYQQLFTWRGAINSMELFDFKVTDITRAFRYGNEIAHAANYLLSLHSSAPINKINGNCGINSQIIFYEPQDAFPKNIGAILTRTRAKIFPLAYEEIRLNRKISVKTEFGIIRWLCKDICHLANNNLDAVTHEYIAKCYSISNLQVELENRPDADVKQALRLYLSYKDDVLKVIDQVETLNQPESEATRLICTTHAVKGREWDTVVIADDFEYVFNHPNASLDDEICTLYVAVTRAKKRIYIPASMRRFFQKN